MREINAELHRQRVSASLVGKFGEQSRRWKGVKASYTAKHMWIIKHYGNAQKCEQVECDYKNPKRYEWHNISGTYKRERSDYIQLCPSCHRKIDTKNKCRKGHEYTSENTHINIRGHRRCRQCWNKRKMINAKAN
jgi:hypothetical protein